MERGGHERWRGYDSERQRESDERLEVDLRRESEVFGDHERMESRYKTDQQIAALRDQLAEESDGILRISIPEYTYNIARNPFIGMGPRVIRLYSIARHLDVIFLHRFMYGDILVCGIRSGDYVEPRRRGKFVEHIRDTGGLPIEGVGDQDYDFEALRFSPYVASDSTMPLLELYHKSELHAGDRPHHPVDVWIVYDGTCYEACGAGAITQTARYRLRPGYARAASMLSIAQIN